MSAMIKNFNLEQVAVAVAAPPSPPPLPPAKKPKQGIGSILGSDSDHRAKTAASIRRTLSADMSSKKWLSQNGFPAIKKIASSGEFADDHPHTFSGEEDELSRPGQDEVWRAIQAAQKPRNDGVKPSLRSCESWSSILTTKNTEDCSKLPPPYVHPLVKARTASSLSEKSLEICTESLGSETGSDGFSSHSPPESGDEEEEQEEEKQDHNLQIPNNSSHSFEAPQAVKQSYSKRSAPRSFPPPLPSLAKNKASLQVLSRRQNGRLILEAVSVPPRDYLHAQRHDGRLLLTLVNGSASEETGDKDETTQLFDTFEETDDTVLIDDEDDEQELTKNSNLLPNIPTPPFMKQFKKNTLWVNNKAVDLIEEEEDLIITPPPPPAAAAAGVAGLIPAAALPHAAAFVNTYDYFWRKKPTVASVIFDTEQCKGGAKNNLKNNNDDNNNNVVESPKVALLRGSMANNMMRGCKESRRSLLPWEPYCIATT